MAPASDGALTVLLTATVTASITALPTAPRRYQGLPYADCGKTEDGSPPLARGRRARRLAVIPCPPSTVEATTSTAPAAEGNEH